MAYGGLKQINGRHRGNSGGIPKVSTRFSLSMEMNRLTRDGTAKYVSRDRILRRERGQVNIHFPCSADHEQDWQPYPADHYACYMRLSYIPIYTNRMSNESDHTGQSQALHVVMIV